MKLLGKTAHEFKTNDKLRNTTLGLVALPAAIATVGVLGTTATGIAVGRTAASAGGGLCLRKGRQLFVGLVKLRKELLNLQLSKLSASLIRFIRL